MGDHRTRVATADAGIAAGSARRHPGCRLSAARDSRTHVVPDRRDRGRWGCGTVRRPRRRGVGRQERLHHGHGHFVCTRRTPNVVGPSRSDAARKSRHILDPPSVERRTARTAIVRDFRVELYAAIRRGARAGLSSRELQRRDGAGWRMVRALLARRGPAPRGPTPPWASNFSDVGTKGCLCRTAHPKSAHPSISR